MKNLYFFLALMLTFNANAELIPPEICDLSIDEASLETVEISTHTIFIEKNIDIVSISDNPSGIPLRLNNEPGDSLVMSPESLAFHCGRLQDNFLKDGIACSCEPIKYSYKDSFWTKRELGLEVEQGASVKLRLQCKQDNPMSGEKIKQIMCKKLNTCVGRLPLNSTRDNFQKKLDVIEETREFLKCGESK